MDDDLPPSWISDLDLMRLIEGITRRAATMADVKAWRKAIERERARRARRRSGMAPVLRSAPEESAHALIVDFLLSPEGQVLIALFCAGRSLAESLLDGAARRLYDRMLGQHTIARDLRADIDGLHEYVCEKLAPGGRRAPPWPDPAHSLPGGALATLNAASPAALAEWRDRLARSRRSPATRPRLLSALRVAGDVVQRAHPDLDLSRPMAGPAIGIWPPAPPDPGQPSGDDDPQAAPVAPERR